MKKLMQGCLTSILLLLVSTAFAKAGSPVGYWLTYDDVTGKGKGVVRIFENHGYLYGQIIKTIPTPGKPVHKICTACQGYRHNKPILGMVIMEGLSQNLNDHAEWGGGTILDPLNGKTYRCKLRVMESGQKLNVRGFIGFSLFGRTQTWVRTEG